MSETIRRDAAIETAKRMYAVCDTNSIDDYAMLMEEALKVLPSAEPDIIYCKDCRKHNKRVGDCVEKSDGTYDWIWKPDACPLAEFRGKARGHEFDYQFCALGERRTE